MSTEILTINQYVGKQKKYSPQYVRKVAKDKKEKKLPGVMKAMKVGRDWLLEVAI